MAGDTAPEPLSPGARVQGYRIDGLISSGGFGKVYRATDTNGARVQGRRMQAEARRAAWAQGGYRGVAPDAGPTVAIKECLPESFVTRAPGQTQVLVTRSKRPSFEWALRRFEDEAAFLAAQSHAAIVTGWETFAENGTRYLVMEALASQTLEQLVESGGPQSEARVRTWLQPVLRALQSTEVVGVNHLDISPSNILFRGATDPVLIDFGASRFNTAVKGGVSYVIVNDGYSAPEKIEKTSIGLDARCDVYSLAAVALFALTGEPPPASHDRKASPASLKMLLDAARQRATSPFVDALEVCLSMDPAGRPANAALAERVLLGKPPPVSAPVRPRPVAVKSGETRLDVLLRRLSGFRGRVLSGRGTSTVGRRGPLAVILIASGIIALILAYAMYGT